MNFFACILLLASSVCSYRLAPNQIKSSLIRKYSTYIRLNSNDDNNYNNNNNQIIRAASGDNIRVDLSLLDNGAQTDNVVLDPKAAEQNLYSVLASATLSDNNKILNFGPNEFDLMSIYIHPSWPLLYERIRRNLITYNKNHIVVTGIPGIGKSMFKYYYIWRAITEENCTSFLYEEEEKVVDLYSKATVSRITNTLECPTGLPFFVDMLGTKAEPSPKPVRLSAYTIIFSSPDNSRFKDFLKHRGRIQYILEPWTAEEIYEAWRLVPSFYSVPKELVDAQYAIYGGVPRSVFEHADMSDAPMMEALEIKGEEAATRMMSRSTGAGSDIQMSHKLLHMRRKTTASATSLHDDAFFVPASDFVVRELVKTYKEIMFRKFWEWTQYKSTIYQPVSGTIFENLYCLVMCDSQHNITSLPGIVKYGSDVVQGRGPIMDTQSVGRDELLPPDWDEVDSDWVPVRGRLYIQRTASMESADAFMVNNTTDDLYLFQVTVAASHPVKSRGLQSIIELVQTKLGVLLQVRLVFVVPDTTKALKMLQPLHTTDNINYASLSTVPSGLRTIAEEQWRLTLDNPGNL